VCRVAGEMSATALLLFAFASTGGMEITAVVVAALTVSAAIGGPALGVVLDRSRRPGLHLAWAITIHAAGLGATATLLRSNSTGWALVAAFATGLVSSSVAGAWSAQLRGEGGLGRRLAVFDANSYSAAALAGPSCAGLLFMWIGPVAPLTVTAALLLSGAAFATALPLPEPRPDPQPKPTLGRDLVRGLLLLQRSPRLRLATLSSCVAFAGMGMFTTAVPLMGQRHFGDPGRGALLLALVAASALVANAVVDRRNTLTHPYRLLAVSTVVAGVGLGLASSGVTWAVITGAILIGLGDGPQLASLITIRHREAPLDLLTQVFTTGASLKMAAAGVGALIAGGVAGSGLSHLLVIAAVAHILAAAIAVNPALHEL
jgi:MFS family permease